MPRESSQLEQKSFRQMIKKMLKASFKNAKMKITYETRRQKAIITVFSQTSLIGMNKLQSLINENELNMRWNLFGKESSPDIKITVWE